VNYRQNAGLGLMPGRPLPVAPRIAAEAVEIIGGPYNAGRMFAVERVLIGQVSPLIVAALAVMLTASVWVFAQLVRRETSQRRRAILSEWARSRDLRLGDPANTPDASAFMTPLAALNPRIDFVIHGHHIAIVQVRTDNSSAASPTAPAMPRWDLLLRRLDQDWPITALRPTAHTSSIIDLFSLSSFPSLGATQRFVVFGANAAAARALSESSAPALLPPDIGLALHGHFLILDFTPRHFDQIEFGRMIDLAEQLAPRLIPPEGLK
jgi:hypothetical protein